MYKRISNGSLKLSNVTHHWASLQLGSDDGMSEYGEGRETDDLTLWQVGSSLVIPWLSDDHIRNFITRPWPWIRGRLPPAPRWGCPLPPLPHPLSRPPRTPWTLPRTSSLYRSTWRRSVLDWFGCFLNRLPVHCSGAKSPHGAIFVAHLKKSHLYYIS